MSRYWLSFDLGLRGKYEDLYEWLDNLGAMECGESVASFESDKTPAQIAKELSRILNREARIYLIGRDPTDRSKGRMVGKFIIGKRKRAQWSGYAAPTIQGDEEA